MKLAVLSILLLLQLTSEITGYAMQSKRSHDDDDKGFSSFFSALGINLNDFVDKLDDNQESKEALDLLKAVGKQWFNAYKKRKLEPITSTLYKMVRTIIVKTNNKDAKNVLKADNSILKMLDALNSEKDISKLFDEIGQNQELLLQAVQVFTDYSDVVKIVKNKGVDDEIEKLVDNALNSKIFEDFLQSVVQKALELASILDEGATISQAKTPILEFSNFLIDSIADGKLQPILQAIYDASKLVADNIDMNDPKVHTFLNDVLKFEKILKESIKNVNQSTQRRNFFVRQLLKLR